MNNFIFIVLDGVGIGELPDASKYGDEGSSTLFNISKAVKNFSLPNFQKLGLGNITALNGIPASPAPLASFGKMNEISAGKDSTSGHWELGGLKVSLDFSYFPNGFPDEIINLFLKENNLPGILGNKPASGTEIIQQLGDEHVKTGYPIVYTSADSVFQIAAHEEIIPLKELYKICETTRRKVLLHPVQVGRVIARPFLGENGNYIRTSNRKDFSLDPPGKTILDCLESAGITTVGIGKINDLFNYKGISIQENTKSNSDGMNKLIECSTKLNGAFIMANLVDFDVQYGHRNDPEGFAECLKEFDHFIPALLNNIDETDALIITADHGNDPTTPSTDHSREYVPLLFYRKGKAAEDLGTRETFADAAKTAAEFFKVDNSLEGKSFLN
jgi:phosphopentomutase